MAKRKQLSEVDIYIIQLNAQASYSLIHSVNAYSAQT